MICILALIVFGILAIFSASHRPLAKEAFECVFRRVTLRKCETGLDKRLKSQITGRLMRRSPFVAGMVYKHFELISWSLVILLFASLGYSIYGGYNYYLYGNCYGPEDTGGFCIYNALEGEHFSKIQNELEGEIVYPTADNDPSIGPKDAKVTIIEFGCYSCPYSREAQSIVKQLLEKYEGRIRFVFRDFPIDQEHKSASILAEAANCANEQGKFWEFHDKIFTEQSVCTNSEDPTKHIKDIAKTVGLNSKKFNACLASGKYKEEVENDFNDGLKAGVYGTPTFFINNRTIIGPKPIRAFEKIIDEELAKKDAECK